MILAFLLAAIVSGGLASAALLVIGAPLWLVVVAYPATGMLVLVTTAAAASYCKTVRESRSPKADHFPVQRTTTANVANSTRTSVASDSDLS